LLSVCALLLTVVGLLCIELLSYVYFCYLMCIVLLCVYCCLTYCSCRIAGYKSVSGRSCDRPPRHRFFLVSLLRWFPRLQVATAYFSRSPQDLNFLDSYLIFMYVHYNQCHRATANLQLNMLSLFYLYNNNSNKRLLCNIAYTSECFFLHKGLQTIKEKNYVIVVPHM
jgi:hypothetical protein